MKILLAFVIFSIFAAAVGKIVDTVWFLIGCLILLAIVCSLFTGCVPV